MRAFNPVLTVAAVSSINVTHHSLPSSY